jgi:hypothetical protein
MKNTPLCFFSFGLLPSKEGKVRKRTVEKERKKERKKVADPD